jgi:hypothetical protein
MVEHALNNAKCALWVPPGMGKSVVGLTVAKAARRFGDDPRPTLVLGPLRVAREVWSDEVQKWEHLEGCTVQPVVGTLAERLNALKAKADVYTINYESLPWLLDKLKGQPWPFGRIIADEASKLKGLRVSIQTSKKGNDFVRGQGSTRAKALSKVVAAKDGPSAFLELTGTPASNGVKDLWGQLWFLDQGKRLGRTYTGFQARWFDTDYNGRTLVPRPYAFTQITEACRDLCLSVEPPPMAAPYVTERVVTLDKKTMAVYLEMEKRMFVELKGVEIEAFNAAAKTMKCLQIANGALYTEEGNNSKFAVLHDAKLDELESIVEECGGAPLLVAYHFDSDLARLRKRFPHGLNLAVAKDLARAKAGEGTVWFGHPGSVAHGIDGLQHHCNRLAVFGHWWDLEQYQQIVERIGPMRQFQANTGKPVYIYHILARDTIDEVVVARRDAKQSVQDAVLDYMKRKK